MNFEFESMATKIPNIKKFRGDNDVSLALWFQQLEATLRAMNIENVDVKWKNILLCCTESVAFSAVSDAVVGKSCDYIR